MDFLNIKTLGELRRSGYRTKKIKEEIRLNLIKKIEAGEEIFYDIIGYEETVLPYLINALLSGHNIIFLGERGQAKSRLIRRIVNLLDEYIPIVEGCEINDDPFNPVCPRCKRLFAERGDSLPIEWLPRHKRYGEKLATPDTTVSDLIGEIDPVKVSEGRRLGDPETIHYGLIPRTNRGIFAINELPDLPERIQVSLFNLLEEGDMQIKGYKLYLPMDILVLASANPEDYTNRGRIVTPLKDRFDAQIRTHYPVNVETEIKIMEQEAKVKIPEGYELKFPYFMKEVIANITFEARKSPEVNQRSGVSVRMSIANYEAVITNAFKRALKLKEKEFAPRISDLHAIMPCTMGKIELEYTGEELNETLLIQRFIKNSVKKVFDSYFSVDLFKNVILTFEKGFTFTVSDDTPLFVYTQFLSNVDGTKGILMDKLHIEDSPSELAAGTELMLEGLYLHRKISKEVVKSGYVFKI
jgi:magnesium chelatase subunit I